MKEDKQFERIPPIRPGEEVLRRKRRPRIRLRMAPNIPGFVRFFKDAVTRTPFVPLLSILVALWLLFAAGIYFAERGAGGAIDSYGDALYWGIAGFSTAGIADTPLTATGLAIGAIWIVVGSVVFFGAIVATVTAYFQLPRRRPTREIVTTVQYNLEKLEELSLEELETLKDAALGLIEARIDQLKAQSPQE